MKKEFGVFLIFSLLVLSSSFASAGWFSDVFGKITGNAVASTCDSGTGVKGVTNCNQYSVGGVTLNTDVCVCSGTCGECIACDGRSTGLTYCYKSDPSCTAGCVASCTSFNYSGWSACTNGQETRTIMSQSPSGCSGGSPVLNQSCTISTPTNTCTDSDGGLNYWVKGKVNTSFYYPNQTWGMAIIDDVCINSTFLQEQACNAVDGLHQPNTYLCPNGCSNGACVNTTTPVQNVTCTDSDGGLNYYVKGNITATGGSFSVPYQDYDKCGPMFGDVVQPNVLNEHFCMTGGPNNELYTCPNGCVDGACVNASAPVEPTPSCGENYKIRATNFALEDMNDAVDLEIFTNEAWATLCFEKRAGESCDIGNVEILIGSINRTGKTVELSVETPSIFDYKQISAYNQFVSINSLEMVFNKNEDDYVVVSYCGGSCESVIDKIKNPTDMIIDGQNWVLDWNNSYTENNVTSSYSSWSRYDDYSSNYVWVNVFEFSDESAVQSALNKSLENGLCQVSRIYNDDETDTYKNVYVCQNIWRIASQNQQILQNNGDNYQDDVVVLWFNDNLFFSVEFSSNNYNTCYDEQSCQVMEQENQRRQQADLIATISNLINNQNEYTSLGYLDYNSEQFVKYFLESCGSEVEDLGYEGAWFCRMEPAICPPHGEQKQICARWNQITQKNEKRESVMQCNPGICSGCMIPRWFQDDWSSKCIPYGFRFEYQNGWSYEITQESSQDQIIEGNTGIVLDYIDATQAVIRLDWNNATYTMQVGNTVVLDLTGLNEEEIISAEMTLDEIQYSSQEGVASSVLVTFNVVSNQQTPSTLNAYCDIDGRVKQQKTDAWGACQNNYECESNLCSYGECVGLKELANELQGFRGFLTRMLCRLSNPFSSDDYNSCLAENI